MDSGVMQDFCAENELRRKILAALRESGMTRADLVLQLGVPRTTLYDTLAKLIANRQVQRIPVQTGKRGRPRVMFFLSF